MKHNKDCSCEMCRLAEQGLSGKEIFDRMDKMNKELLDKYGFYIHAVLPEEGDVLANFHTHGLLESKNHMDFQIVLPIDPKMASQLFWTFVDRINEGEEFKPNTEVSNIIQNFNVKLIRAKEVDRFVLRILLPDPQGHFPGDEGCHPIYSKQGDMQDHLH